MEKLCNLMVTVIPVIIVKNMENRFEGTVYQQEYLEEFLLVSNSFLILFKNSLLFLFNQSAWYLLLRFPNIFSLVSFRIFWCFFEMGCSILCSVLCFRWTWVLYSGFQIFFSRMHNGVDHLYWRFDRSVCLSIDMHHHHNEQWWG